MTRVLAIGYDDQPLLREQPVLHAFPSSLGRDDLGPLLGIVGAELARGHEIVAIAPRWLSGPQLQRLQTVRAALDTSRLTVHTSALPPLAGAVLCALAAALGEVAPSAGALHAALPSLERDLVVVARLGSVARLAHPAPTPAQRALSAWPGSAFAVSWWPRPAVRTLRVADDGVALPPRAAWSGPAAARLAVAAPSDAGLDWVEQRVVPLFGGPEVVRVDQPPFSTLYWGTRQVVEVVAYPTDAAALLTPVPDAGVARRCPWCGAAVVSAVCPFCDLTPVRALSLSGRPRT